MTKTIALCFAASSLLLACGGEQDNSSDMPLTGNTGGGGQMNATAGSGGDLTGNGGGASGGEQAAPPTGGAPMGGTPPVADGGSDMGGSGAEAGGGGTDAGGAGGADNGGADNGGADNGNANPSPGCGQGGRPADGKVYKAGESWLVFPEKYDGQTPLPVLFGFHGCGGTNFGDANRTEFWDHTRDSGFETDYVVAIPLAASGSCFDYRTDIVRAKALYDELVENYCVDLDRVFGTGHSSGAGFLMEILASANQADFEHFNFRGIAPVSAWLIGSQSTAVPTMYIQGVTDSERGGGDGKDVVDKIVSVNECSSDTTPYEVDDCSSTHDGDPVNANCVSYGDCGSTSIWCSHDDSNYSGTFHGIPCFFKQAAYDFFQSL